MRHSFTLIELLTVTRLRPSGYGRASRHRGSFTLIELLVVIAIVAILSAVVIITLNPAELLKQSRDSNRLSDLNTLNKALALFEVDVVGGSLGSSSTVYVSLPDTSATCLNLGLPTLPAGYQYGCVTEANLRKTDGTGWIPVNLTEISSNTPLGSLPTDPVNATSSGLYYTYVPGGSYELTGLMESAKRKTEQARDGGPDPGMYEIGSNLSLSPFVHRLVGWWDFEEGSGSSVPDRSGWGNAGTWNGAGAHYTTNSKLGRYSANFNGADDYVQVPDAASLKPGTQLTVMGWFNSLAISNSGLMGRTGSGSPNEVFFAMIYQPNASLRWYINGTAENYGSPAAGQWQHFAAVYDSAAQTKKVYLNGSLAGQTTQSGALNTAQAYPLRIGAYYYTSASSFFGGKMDDMRVYNRALSAEEIAAIYAVNQ